MPLAARLAPRVVPGAKAKVWRSRHPVVPLGSRPAEHSQVGAEGEVALESRPLRHMKVILVILLNVDMKMILVARAVVKAKENLTADKIHPNRKEKGREKGRLPMADGGSPHGREQPEEQHGVRNGGRVGMAKTYNTKELSAP